MFAPVRVCHCAYGLRYGGVHGVEAGVERQAGDGRPGGGDGPGGGGRAQHSARGRRLFAGVSAATAAVCSAATAAAALLVTELLFSPPFCPPVGEPDLDMRREY
jgi:hypothetical protein